jgi:type II restriction enzyme
MKTETYLSVLGAREVNDIIDAFFSTLLDTNWDHKFLVDWNKIKENVRKYEIELNILNSLIRNQNFEKTLKTILSNYPEVLPCFPLLLAVRDRKLRLIDDVLGQEANVLYYDFTPRNLSKDEIDLIVNFVKKTGLRDFFLKLSSASLFDYLAGLEVGLDTNARKNRSGLVMEMLIENMVKNACEQLRLKEIIKQKKI